MPVHDAEVHEKVKIKEDSQYSCGVNPVVEGYYTMDRVYFPNGKWVYRQVFVPHTMSRDCRYDKRPTDPRCGGCKRQSDKEYLKSYGL